MKPSDDANSASPARVQSAAPSTIPTATTARPPPMPAWPNQRGILRARWAPSEAPMITVAAHPDDAAAASVADAKSATACRARKLAPPSTTTLAKNPSGSKRTSLARRLAMNQRYAKTAPVNSAAAARRWSVPRMSAGSASATYAYPSAGSWARVTRAKLQHRQMKPTLVLYDAPGFGVGEVWLERGRVFYAELPRPRKASAVSESGLAARLTAFFAGADDDLRDVPLRLPGGFHGKCARALRKIGRGEVVTYGELAALAGYPGAARAAGTFCGGCSPSKASSCDAPLGGAARRAGADRAASYLLPPRGAVRALPRERCLAPARGQRGRSSRPGQLRRGSPSVRAAARPRRALGDPHLPPPRVRAIDALPAAHRRGCRRARRLAGRGRPVHVARTARAPAAARRRPVMLPWGVPARRAARRRLALGAARPAPRDQDGDGRRRPVHRRRRGARGRRAQADRAPRPRRRVREGARSDRRRARVGRRGRHGALPRGTRGRRGDARAGQPPRERRRGQPRARGTRRASAARGDPLARPRHAARAPCGDRRAAAPAPVG